MNEALEDACPQAEGARLPYSHTQSLGLPGEEVNSQTLLPSVQDSEVAPELRGLTLRKFVGASLQKQT